MSTAVAIDYNSIPCDPVGTSSSRGIMVDIPFVSQINEYFDDRSLGYLDTFSFQNFSFFPDFLTKAIPNFNTGFWGTSSRLFLAECVEIIPQEKLSENALAKLGDNCRERFEKFQQLRPGWDFGKGTTLSSYSISSMESFLNHMPGFDSEPSIFMSPHGFLQLVWEDKSGNDIELEFLLDKIEIYIESDFSEYTVPLEAHKLIQLANKLIHL